MKKAIVAVYKFGSCAGCQLELLNYEEGLLDLLELVDFAQFYEATRDNRPGPYDLGLVEGAIISPDQVEVIKKAREDCKVLVAVGACATTGGVPALKNDHEVGSLLTRVYPGNEKDIETLNSGKGIDAYVKVDYYLQGCPVERSEILELVHALFLGRRPDLKPWPVCMECKMKENVCLVVSRSESCMGPVTRAGCGALCPTFGRPCYNCHGPMSNPNPKALMDVFAAQGLSTEDIVRKFTGYAREMEPFKKGIEEYVSRVTEK